MESSDDDDRPPCKLQIHDDSATSTDYEADVERVDVTPNKASAFASFVEMQNESMMKQMKIQMMMFQSLLK